MKSFLRTAKLAMGIAESMSREFFNHFDSIFLSGFQLCVVKSIAPVKVVKISQFFV